jgi:heme A synthase
VVALSRDARPLARFAWLVLAYNLGVILWGAVVRATGSGAGCGNHWPLCNGEVLPRARAIETMIEFSHRATSGIALLLVIGLVGWALRSLPRGHPARLGSGLALFFILTEAAVGAGLVLFEMVADNRSMARALWMAGHLVNTFFLLASLALTAHWADGGAPLRLRGRGSTPGLVLLGLAATTLVGVSGAVAALGDTLFPATSLAQALEQELSGTSHLLIRLRLLHPLIAVVAAALLLGLAATLPPRSADPRAGRLGRWLAGLVIVQMAVGMANVALLAPVWMQVVHLLLADLVWIALVLLGARALAEPPAPS